MSFTTTDAGNPPMTAEAVEERLDRFLDAVLSSRRTAAKPARVIAALDVEQQRFALHWVEVIARRNPELGYQFAAHVGEAFAVMGAELVELWVVGFMDRFDRAGMLSAAGALRDVAGFAAEARRRESGLTFDAVAGILERFVQGLSGRRLQVQAGDEPYTDTETLFVPAEVFRFSRREQNFALYKAICAHQWAQARFGTFRADLESLLAEHSDPDRALRWLGCLDTLRLDACIAAELPGLARQMAVLAGQRKWLAESAAWRSLGDYLLASVRSPERVLECLPSFMNETPPVPVCYQSGLYPERVAQAMGQRLKREKTLFREALGRLAREQVPPRDVDRPGKTRFGLRRVSSPDRPDGLRFTLELDGHALRTPPEVRGLMDSIVQDLGEIPPEYLSPAGDGGYAADARTGEPAEGDDVWKGTYHEQGASIYNEWDFDRGHYRKSWCTLREVPVHPGAAEFVPRTLQKYRGLVKNLRRGFEALRGEDKVLKRQAQGDDVDLDALVEALADARSGMEMTDRLFARRRKVERDIAVMFMVDMSGSTKGWINDAERESLVLLCEALETLGDRYAIYGFSGLTRKRCELYRIKRFDDPYDGEVKQRIAGISPREYTRMGVVIRHLSSLLRQQPARTRLLITLSDGKPDDYDGYRGRYGIEDTRQALLEARRDGIQAFCITIDKEAREYLPHMYGRVNYTLVDDVRRLPAKVSDIYRRLTA